MILRSHSVFVLLGVSLAVIVFLCQLLILSEPESSVVNFISETRFDQFFMPTMGHLNATQNVFQMGSIKVKSSSIYADEVHQMTNDIPPAKSIKTASSLSRASTKKKRRHNNVKIKQSRTLSTSQILEKVDSPVSDMISINWKKNHVDLSETKNNKRQTSLLSTPVIEFESSNGLVNVVSMSLYGSDPRYVEGAVRNAQLIRQNFPGWQLWIYVESSESSRYGAVPPHIIARLVELGAEIHYVTPDDDFVPPMMWRFLVADDPAVDRFIIRDVDSRLTRRDAATVSQWIRSGKAFHCVRDHPSHAAYAVSGGLWGGRAPELRSILRRSWATMMRGVAAGYLNDMNFLNELVWPRVSKQALCTDSVSCDRWPSAVSFPVVRHGYEHVGQVYSENDVVREVDVNILRKTAENINCVPQVAGAG